MKVRSMWAGMMTLVLLIVCLAGCGNKLTAEQILEKATEKQQTMDDIDADIKMSMSMQAEGETVDYDVTMKMKESGITTESPKMAMQMDMNILGQSIRMNTYYTEGYSYTEAMGQKMKMAMDLSEMSERLKQNSAFMEIQADAYQSLELTEEGNHYVIDFEADGDKMNELAETLLDSMMSNALGDAGDFQMSVGEVQGVLTIDKDFNIVKQEMKMDMTMTVEDTDVSIALDMDMDVNNPGKEVEVELPDDLDTYEEISDGFGQ